MATDDLPIFIFPKHKRVAKSIIDGLEGLYTFRFTKLRDQRTLNQNSYMHGVVFVYAAKGLSDLWGKHVDMLHAKAFLKDRYLRTPEVNPDTGEVLGYYTRDTHSLDVDECRQFIESCLEFCADELQMPVPSREEYEQPMAKTG